ncbi:penicillin acylase family protein [Rhodohalobacter sp. 8-1]|uniref:penicillin acylase family protein n=1 Tax=Rhodohalobacter sp. 8-1 TaxID=3131972 RepID=UPI0030EC7DCC
MKILFRVSIFIVILLIGIIGITGYHTFYKQLPDHTAVIQASGLEASVEVHWDPYGVPYVYADNESDLYFAIGYVHAQDRLWQLTLAQLMAEGRFSEFLGDPFIEVDKHQRTLGIWRTAKAIINKTSPQILTNLEHYAEGINTYVAQNSDKLPIEMTLLGIPPINWTPSHSVAVSRLMAWDQNIQWKSEIAIALLAAGIGNSKVNQLLPSEYRSGITESYTADTQSIASVSAQFLETDTKVKNMLQNNGGAIGSNAWALSGSLTTSGKAMLAGDPHMGLSMPGNWYELHASTPEFSITGATIPGTPFVVIGQNEHLAWSITNMMADDTDFYLIENNPEAVDQYVADSSNGQAVYENYTWQQEIIGVKDSDDVLFRIPHTKHGPIINEVHPDGDKLGLKPVAMRWAGHEVSHELQAIYELNKAETLDEFTQGLEHFGSPVMNFIYADNKNNIARIGAGRLPVRFEDATNFKKGWDTEQDWAEWIPFDQMPRNINPESGFVANANNSVITESYPYYIGRFWATGSRISRIQYLVNENVRSDVNAMQRMQADIFSEHAADLTEVLLPLLRNSQRDNEFETVLTYLENWDHRYSINSTAATIFDLFFLKLSDHILDRDVPENLREGLYRLEYIPVRMVTEILLNGSSYFNTANEEAEQIRQQVIRSAMIETITQLSDEFGPEPFAWRWEALHTLTLSPPLLGEISDSPDSPETLGLIVRNLLSEGPHPVPGHGMTINKGEYSWNNPFEVTLGPSIRRIIDFSEPYRSLSVLPTGQSGNPLSANYGDQTDLWLEGRYRYIYSDSTFFLETNVETMRLEPLSVQ